ncbi:hypothetical protein LCGC14_1597170 [marine sediment metagenome]|uniref:GTP cyclohydrolase I n=1 Tax=marine sediment metagenome TaxID=412755 RepID=A0A0F9ICM6_9ZZZZ
MNRDRINKSIVALLIEIHGPDWYDNTNLKDTPGRVAKMYEEMLGGHEFTFTTMPNTDKYNQIILVDHIPFTSMCMHHIIPFFGHASVAYIPDGKIAGLSKLTRAVEHFARKLQLQENLTQETGEFIQKKLKPLGTAVIIEAEHLCMRGRGVRKSGVITKTSYLRGAFLEKPAAREELMFLLRSK